MNVIKTKNGQEVLLPKNDYLFKLIFGDKRNKHLLKGFLRAVLELPPDDFDVEFIDTHSKPDIEHKLCILDVRVITNTGKQIDIEMQVVQTEALFERICFYKSLMITEQLGSGMGYEQIKKVISIVIADFVFVEGGLPESYHHCFNFIDKADGARFGDV